MDTVYGCDRDDVTHIFSIALAGGDEKRLVELHLDSGNFAAMCKAIRKVYPPSWTIDKFLLIWEDSI